MSNFARPVNQLVQSILPEPDIRVTPIPASGHGVTVDDKGRIPVTQETGETWRVEVVTVSVDPSNLAAQEGELQNVTIPGLKVGDYAFYMGGAVTSALNIETRSLCTTENTIVINIFNCDSVDVNAAANDFPFFVLHRVP